MYHFCCKGAEPNPGHVMEHAMGIANILIQVGFIYGSWCFYSGHSTDTVEIGDSIFLLGSAFTLVTCCHSLYESKFRVSQFVRAAYVENTEEEEARDEACENVMFILAAVFFAGGGFCYWPTLTENMSGEDAEYVYACGAWFFCAGSMGFLLAAYFNAVGMSACAGSVRMTRKDWHIHYIKHTALLASILGSVAFLMGSYLYRPDLSNNTCKRGSNFGFCTDVADSGTTLYIVGSILYTIDSSLAYVVTLMNCMASDDEVSGDDGGDYEG